MNNITSEHYWQRVGLTIPPEGLWWNPSQRARRVYRGIVLGSIGLLIFLVGKRVG
jgi:hypothetical protein